MALFLSAIKSGRGPIRAGLLFVDDCHSSDLLLARCDLKPRSPA
jgi:hypothetical protein